MPKSVKKLSREDFEILAVDSIFRGAAMSILKQNFKRYQCMDFGDGEILFLQNSEVQGLFIVLKGLVSLTDDSSPGRRPHGTIEAGQSLGDYELFADGSPEYEITARAMGEVRALFVPRLEVKMYLQQASRDAIACIAINAAKDVAGKAIRTSQRLKAVYEDGTYQLAQVIAYENHHGRAHIERCRVRFGRQYPDLYPRLRIYERQLKSLGVIVGGTRSPHWLIDITHLASLIHCSEAGLEAGSRPSSARSRSPIDRESSAGPDDGRLRAA